MRYRHLAMSLDIDWSLLTPSSISSNLLDKLNAQLASAPRPSFIGPISITSFHFGTAAPDVEIKDIRDVWRAFDEGDEEGDEALSQLPPVSSRREVESKLEEESYEVVHPAEAAKYYSEDDGGLDDISIYSGLASPRPSVAAVGIGLGGAAMHFGIGRDYASAILSPGPSHHHHPNLFSQPHLTSTRRHRPSSQTLPPVQSFSPPPPSPPARPAGVTESKSSIPSLQLHLKVNYTSDLALTLLTSLSINYPSPSFMSLPLKLSITGLTLAGDVVLAYSGDKHRVHLCLLDEETEGHTGIPIGQRILPNLNIDSEIGHADAHILRNVGKVERFIADVVRKTMVDELVFPNFLTIAL